MTVRSEFNEIFRVCSATLVNNIHICPPISRHNGLVFYLLPLITIIGVFNLTRILTRIHHLAVPNHDSAIKHLPSCLGLIGIALRIFCMLCKVDPPPEIVIIRGEVDIEGLLFVKVYLLRVMCSGAMEQEELFDGLLCGGFEVDLLLCILLPNDLVLNLVEFLYLGYGKLCVYPPELVSISYYLGFCHRISLGEPMLRVLYGGYLQSIDRLFLDHVVMDYLFQCPNIIPSQQHRY